MSSSIICRNFVQNAWKKELCSNCFKSKDEHRKSASGSISTSNTITSMLYSTNNNNISKPRSASLGNKAYLNAGNLGVAKYALKHECANGDTCTDGKGNQVGEKTNTKSIIKTDFSNGETSTSVKKTKNSVHFMANLAQVIGYGGEDWSEEEEDVIAYEESIESNIPTEEEDELNRLTKLNTDFNVNLTSKKLQLGKPQMDAEGKKQTLLVQVTPFGQETKNSSVKQAVTMCNKFVKNNNSNTVSAEPNNIEAVRQDQPSINMKPRESNEVTKHLNDAKSNKSDNTDQVPNNIHIDNQVDKIESGEKSLLDEITETLEKSKISVNPTKKIVHKEIILKTSVGPPSNNENKVPSASKLTRNPAIKEKKTYQSSKLMNLYFDKDTSHQSIDSIASNKDKHNDNSPEDKDSATGGSSLDDSSSHCGSEDSHSDSSLENDSKHKLGEMKLHAYQNVDIPSRELVGEPDGRAESDGTDEPLVSAPALPMSPPPVQNNSLHLFNSEKPKIPTKPSTILICKPPNAISVNQVVLSTFNSDKLKPNKISSSTHTPFSGDGTNASNVGHYLNSGHTQIQKRDSNGSDISKKRRAPKPPQEESGNSIYMRKTSQISNTDCPVVREKEKRERASSCTPKIILNDVVGSGNRLSGPEPAPRRSLSLSTDSLASNSEDKKKKAKFSLKKLLRMGSSNSGKADEEKPLPKPRLVIVHPLDINSKGINLDYEQNEQEYVNTTFLKEQIQVQKDRENARPPPPPRNYDNSEAPNKLPPKSTQVKQLQHQTQPYLSKKIDSVYANIGEVRSAITPNKPQRTASMREIKDVAAQNLLKTSSSQSVYEPTMTAKSIELNSTDKNSDKNEEHVYDLIGNRSSSPECDSKSIVTDNKIAPANGQAGVMSRSVSMTYCGSETESEIYSPYSYYGSESEVAEDEQECCYGNGLGSTGRTHKLRSKKGRSIVHKNLEDNYGAVVIANHEALAQVLENIQQTTPIPVHLRSLKSSENLRWNDFTIRPTAGTLSQQIKIGNCLFYQATWNLLNVTLMITIVQNSPSCSLGTLILQSVTEFSDLVPTMYLQTSPELRQLDFSLQATISVLPHLQIQSISAVGRSLKQMKNLELPEIYKASIVLLLQLINSLKTLQAQGVEELPLSLNSFVFAKDVEKQEAHYRLYILHPNEEPKQELGTLCLIVSKVMDLLPMDTAIKKLIQSLLPSERAVTLSQVKSLLEFLLWGPSDVALGSTASEREFVLQRWLDLQRATVLHGLVCAKVQLTVYEECHLLFLVRSNAKMMCDASLLLEPVRSR